MKNYIPFLKAKSGEFSGLKNLSDEIACNITPFFDIPRKNKIGYSEEDYKKLIGTIVRKISLNLTKINCFYIDDYDIDDSLTIAGIPAFQFVMQSLCAFPFIPVVGINRSDERNRVVFDNYSLVKQDTIAVRVGVEDIQTGLMDIQELLEFASKCYSYIELIIDLRVVGANDNIEKIISIIRNYLERERQKFSKIVITGSSIPTSTGSIVAPNRSVDLERKEIEIQRRINLLFPDLFYGDYTTISPNYSDISIDPRIIPNIMTARVIYSYSDRHFIIRGSSIRKAGFDQYKNFCKQIVNQPFFRGESYSFGDSFIANSFLFTKSITAATIVSPSVNSHITYMYNDFSF